jgi:F-type H+-transporting ATPase subunit a
MSNNVSLSSNQSTETHSTQDHSTVNQSTNMSNPQSNTHIESSTNVDHSASTMHTDSTHNADMHGAEHKPDEMQQMLGDLGDHYGFVWSNYHLFDLPFIIYDNGLHVYTSEEAVNTSGQFKLIEEHGHKKLVNASTNVPVQYDLSITNLVAFEFITMFLLLVAFFKAKSSYSKSPNSAPTGFQNALESIIVYVRDEIVRPNLPSERIANKLTPYYMVLFFFILAMNFIGMVPGGHTPTSAMETTAALAVTAFVVINFSGIKHGGAGHYFYHLSTGGAPWYLFPLMLPLEILSIFIKPFVLTIRLFANMTAGHLILVALTGVIIVNKAYFAAIPIVPFSVFILLLEVLVAFLQAFVFTMLTCIFTGLAIGHDKEEAHGH